MATEIERKFLVKGDSWRGATGVLYRQGYIPTEKGRTVRVRVAGDRAYLTIKGPSQGYSRAEFEYAIPVEDAQQMLDTLCDRPLIEKKRYLVKMGNVVWEIDEFMGDNEGLILAEVELVDENQAIELPKWIDREVTDPKYFNVNLAKYPFSQWEQTNY